MYDDVFVCIYVCLSVRGAVGVNGKVVSAAIASAIQSQQAKSALEQQRKERMELIKNLTTSGATCMFVSIYVSMYL